MERHELGHPAEFRRQHVAKPPQSRCLCCRHALLRRRLSGLRLRGPGCAAPGMERLQLGVSRRGPISRYQRRPTRRHCLPGRDTLLRGGPIPLYVEYKASVVRWSGSNWTSMDSPNSSRMTFATFNGIACVTTSICSGGCRGTDFRRRIQAVDRAIDRQHLDQDGEPDTERRHPQRTRGVACTSASSCVAVGTHVTNGVTHALLNDGTAQFGR